MVRVIIIGPMGENEIGAKRTEQPNDLAAIVERGQKLAVVVVPHLVVGTNDRAGGRCFGAASTGERGPGAFMVARIAVCQAHHVDSMSGLAKQRRRAAGGIIRVVRVSADDEQAERCHMRRVDFQPA